MIDEKILLKKLESIATDFKGNGLQLERAIGAAFTAKHYGWRVAKLIHGKRDYRKFQEILDIDFESNFPENTDLSSKNLAWRTWNETGKFWDIVMDRQKMPNKGKKSDFDNKKPKTNETLTENTQQTKGKKLT